MKDNLRVILFFIYSKLHNYNYVNNCALLAVEKSPSCIFWQTMGIINDNKL